MGGRSVGILRNNGAFLYVKLSILTSRVAGMPVLSFFRLISTRVKLFICGLVSLRMFVVLASGAQLPKMNHND